MERFEIFKIQEENVETQQEVEMDYGTETRTNAEFLYD